MTKKNCSTVRLLSITDEARPTRYIESFRNQELRGAISSITKIQDESLLGSKRRDAQEVDMTMKM
jgi:hypothetical protein